MNHERLTRSASRESLCSTSSAISGVGDWAVGDRCRVNERVATIAYIGPTRFAPGEWVGVVLDEPQGKNDGSVQGHRYFACTPHHGLFCKSGKLERIVQSPTPMRLQQRTTATLGLPTTPERALPAGSPHAAEFGYDIGDRVVVSGNKLGTLRFLDVTEFAQGVWAGVELDQPTGKNDGAVQGKRYFVCKAPYGIFAPAAKTVRAANQSPAKGPLTVRHTKTSAMRISKTGSHESLSSIGAASSIASSRNRMAPPSQRPVHRPNVVSSSMMHDATIATLQDSLREREKHVEQLIRERDIERNEMARLAHRCEEAEQRQAQIAHLSTANANSTQETGKDEKIAEMEKRLAEMEAKYQQCENSRRDLADRYDEAHRKADDLSFRMEEEMILRAEIETKLAEHVGVVSRDAQQVQERDASSDAELRQSQAKITELETKLTDASLALMEASEKCTAASTSAQALREEKRDMQERFATQIDQLKLLNANAEGEKRELMGKCEKMNDELKAFSDERAKLLQEREQLEAREKATVEEKKKMELEMENLRATLGKLEETSAHNMGEIARLNAENAVLQKAGDGQQAIRNTIVELETAKQAAIDEKEQLKVLAAENAAEIARLRQANEESGKSIADLNTRLGAAEGTTVELQSHTAKLNQELSAACAKNSTLEAEKRDAEAKVAIVEGENGVLTKTVEELKTSNEELKLQCATAERSSQALAGQLQSKDGELQSANEERNALQNRMKALDEERSQIAGDLQVARDEIQSGREQLAALRSQLASGENNLEADKMKIMALLDEKQKIEMQLSTAKSQIAIAGEKEAQMQSEMAKLTGEMDAAKSANGKLEEEMRRQSEQLASLEKLNAEEKGKYARLEGELGECKTQMAAREKELAAMASHNDANAQDLQLKLGAEIAALNERLNASQGDVAKFQARAESGESSLRNCETRLKECEDERVALTGEISSLRDELRAHQEEGEKMRNDQAKTSTEMAEHVVKIAKLEEELTALKSALSSEQSGSRDMQSQLTAVKNERDALVEQLRRAQSELEGKCGELCAETRMKSELQTSLDDAISRGEVLEKQVAEMASAMKSGEGEREAKMAALLADVEQLRAENAGNNVTIATLTQKMADRDGLAEQLAILEKQKCELLEQSNKTANELKQLQSQLSESQRKYSDLAAEKTASGEQSTREIERLQAELRLNDQQYAAGIAQQKAQLLDAANVERQLGEKTAVFVAEIASLKAQLETARQTKSDNQQITELAEQVAFLHSIIADQKRKETALKEEIAILQRLPDDVLATPGSKREQNAPTLRPYCDICEQFDLHETEDCPIQAMQSVEEADHSHYGAGKGGKALPRPYCDHCEAFVHDTSECPNNLNDAEAF